MGLFERGNRDSLSADLLKVPPVMCQRWHICWCVNTGRDITDGVLDDCCGLERCDLAVFLIAYGPTAKYCRFAVIVPFVDEIITCV